MKGVNPEELDGELAHCGDGPGSENRTRFLDRFGVCGGVEMPWICRNDVVASIWVFEQEPMLAFRLLRRTERGRSSLRSVMEMGLNWC